MKKSTIFLHLRKGFTLIELMIVIVILGVLMGTILPRLTGAQARARDTGRIADLGNIAQALEVFYNDKGKYPGATVGTAECLAKDNADLKDYMKGSQIPTPPSAAQVTGSCTGQYVYIPLAKNGIDFSGYVLVTDVETYQMANAKWADVEGAVYEAIDNNVKYTAEDTDGATESVYVYKP
ncbi:prepilin-type N-terminal cleavage/methylation domain-containing protein [Candidatus Peregrinibacteria bacterium]|nr:prepilin-type N-terminal cleavage/methylation domain-containing protein [Candidatus Peregrinibacteria bacterium]